VKKADGKKADDADVKPASTPDSSKDASGGKNADDADVKPTDGKQVKKNKKSTEALEKAVTSDDAAGKKADDADVKPASTSDSSKDASGDSSKVDVVKKSSLPDVGKDSADDGKVDVVKKSSHPDADKDSANDDGRSSKELFKEAAKLQKHCQVIVDALMLHQKSAKTLKLLKQPLLKQPERLGEDLAAAAREEDLETPPFAKAEHTPPFARYLETPPFAKLAMQDLGTPPFARYGAAWQEDESTVPPWERRTLIGESSGKDAAGEGKGGKGGYGGYGAAASGGKGGKGGYGAATPTSDVKKAEGGKGGKGGYGAAAPGGKGGKGGYGAAAPGGKGGKGGYGAATPTSDVKKADGKKADDADVKPASTPDSSKDTSEPIDGKQVKKNKKSTEALEKAVTSDDAPLKKDPSAATTVLNLTPEQKAEREALSYNIEKLRSSCRMAFNQEVKDGSEKVKKQIKKQELKIRKVKAESFQEREARKKKKGGKFRSVTGGGAHI